MSVANNWTVALSRQSYHRNGTDFYRTLEQSDIYLKSLSGVGSITIACFASQIGSIEKFSSASKLAYSAGISPEDDSSDKTKRKNWSKSGNRQLNAAIHRIALNQISVSQNITPKYPIFYNYYQQKGSKIKLLRLHV